MAKFIIFFFVTLGSGVSYVTYEGLGQETIETLQKEETIRTSSYHRSGSGGSYSSGGYSYGK